SSCENEALLRTDATTSLEQTLVPIDRYDRVMQDGQQPPGREVRQVRKECLQTAVQGYETLIKEDSGTDSLQLGLARAQLRLAQATAATGSKAQAIDGYLQGLSILERGAQNHPESAAYQEDLANAYHSLGVLYRDLGQIAQADRAFQNAMDIYRRSEPRPAADSEQILRLAALYSERAVAQAATGNWDTAREWYTQAIQALGTLPQAQLHAQD